MAKPFREQLEQYIPWNEQEETDKIKMLDFLINGKDVFLRDNEAAHFTASAWIVNGARDKVLMVYHNIYRSWSWTGGHADGETDLLSVAVREAGEETGVIHLSPVDGEIFSLEVMTVDGHEKKGKYVSSHLHYNVTYLLEAREEDPLTVKPDENSGVAWFPVEDALKACTEPWMVERIYRKLVEKVNRIS